jgi:N-terminal domain of Peptidase_S41 in eukaryotic IRBP
MRDLLDALDREYVFPDVAARLRKVVMARRDSGQYTQFLNASAFAAALTSDLQNASHDKHLAVFRWPRRSETHAVHPRRRRRWMFPRHWPVQGHGAGRQHRLSASP